MSANIEGHDTRDTFDILELFYEIKMGLSSPKFVVKEKLLVKVNNSKHC